MKKILLYGLEEKKTKITEKVASEFGIEINKIAKNDLEKNFAGLFNCPKKRGRNGGPQMRLDRDQCRLDLCLFNGSYCWWA